VGKLVEFFNKIKEKLVLLDCFVTVATPLNPRLVIYNGGGYFCRFFRGCAVVKAVFKVKYSQERVIGRCNRGG